VVDHPLDYAELVHLALAGSSEPSESLSGFILVLFEYSVDALNQGFSMRLEGSAGMRRSFLGEVVRYEVDVIVHHFAQRRIDISRIFICQLGYICRFSS
jgi:hypothetical protein